MRHHMNASVCGTWQLMMSAQKIPVHGGQYAETSSGAQGQDPGYPENSGCSSILEDEKGLLSPLAVRTGLEEGFTEGHRIHTARFGPYRNDL